ncbi:poly-gamma-glutamate synthase PgsB [Corynebacterium tapiri]|uniref:Poly-gamma-glutamate synthase PgsB n=1 Tax=Corynebacterium tapiri TaxID=1448266 RepID=A0A5C4U3L2_9CORY|nr:poly-gamma-glutamate synthase PgsB [Corynebacterium tapiri]TNL96642.1 poly-gamma-glutamate synthase PgsB [Corynebacterium tapiri]
MFAALGLSLAASGTGAALFWKKEQKHRGRMSSLDYNIHVNGIRGKSTVTRMLGQMLRECGVQTISKTTGTYACVIDTEAGEHPIQRKGPANINEQYKFLAQWLTPEVNGLVVECMVVRPKYQNICQHTILRSPVTVLTNVRLDHQEEMGDTLEEIAASLCNTVPQGGTLITAERNPDVLEVLERETAARDARLIVAEKTTLSESLPEQFSYIQFEENVAVCLAVAEHLGLNMNQAIKGLLAAEPDPGTTKITTIAHPSGRTIYWVPMFAVNDWESTVNVFRELSAKKLPPECAKVLAVNNRADRTDRATMYNDLIAQDLIGDCDRVALYGDLQAAVRKALVEKGVEESVVVATDEMDQTDGAQLLSAAVEGLPADQQSVAIFGLANIHTEAVTSMRSHVDSLAESRCPDALENTELHRELQSVAS